METNKFEVVDDILEYCKKQIDGYLKLADVSNDPMWYHAKIDALQEMQAYLLKKHM